ncbi:MULTISPECIES: alpha/beta fold hydrolase [Acidovorax]|uniref:Lysophospholipase, alpha-beta hydrolase superfamily n=1 Tax=Acidovorax soli TaxID=592050 RepID=A0A1H4E5E2_9BURK|nr:MULTISPECIES: alpha/beta hydrolase [Acidovorax]SEA80255.1 Lysophospholipase, alpha-beta hydrolase superfamily [Acidovorax soli]
MDTWVLLRGLTRETAHWGRFAEDFQSAWPGARVVSIDLPGNGRFHARQSPATVQGMVAACRAELARQGVQPPFHLLAMSLGAMVATEWARTAPQEISGCVLVNTSFRPFSPFFHRLRPRNYAALLGLALLPRSADAIERTVWRLTSNAPDPRSAVIRDWVAARTLRPVSAANALRQLAAAARYRAPALAPTPRILLLASQNDQLVDSRCSKAIARGWHCALALHADAGHDLPLDAPQWVIEQVQQWRTATAP